MAAIVVAIITKRPNRLFTLFHLVRILKINIIIQRDEE